MPAGDPAPAETARRDVELASEWDGTATGIVGFGEGGWTAVALAAEHGDLVDRLVLVSTPVLDESPSAVAARTLLLYGAKDPAGGHRQARWWKEQLGGRVEMVPGAERDILERVWPRALAHVAPGTIR